MTAYLGLADYLLIAERVLGLAAPQAGFGDVEATLTLRRRPPACAGTSSRTIHSRIGNKRCAFLATVEFVERNSQTWVPAPRDPDETDRVIRAVASGDLGEGDFRDWIAERCG